MEVARSRPTDAWIAFALSAPSVAAAAVIAWERTLSRNEWAAYSTSRIATVLGAVGWAAVIAAPLVLIVHLTMAIQRTRRRASLEGRYAGPGVWWLTFVLSVGTYLFAYNAVRLAMLGFGVHK